MANRGNATWTGFLLMCFALVGLSGLFGTFIIPVPVLRGLARDATLDEVLVAARMPDSSVRLERMRPLLGESAGPVLSGPGSIEERVAKERIAVRNRQIQETDAIVGRSRLLVVMMTLLGAGFGVFVLGMGRR